MTTLTLPHSGAKPRSGNRFGRFIVAVFGGIGEGLAIARRYDALSRMSDSELKALGVTRENLPQAAVAGVKRL